MEIIAAVLIICNIAEHVRYPALYNKDLAEHHSSRRPEFFEANLYLRIPPFTF